MMAAIYAWEILFWYFFNKKFPQKVTQNSIFFQPNEKERIDNQSFNQVINRIAEIEEKRS